MATTPEKYHQVILPETKPSQPIWRVGSTQWAGGHMHQKLVIDGAPPQIGLPPHQIPPYHHPESQNRGLETSNKLEATSHQKLATNGASLKMAPTHTVYMTLHQLKRAGPTYMSWCILQPEHVVTGGGGGRGVHVFIVSHGIPIEIGWNFMLDC